MKSTTETLVSALRILAADIQTDDGVANAAIREAADRLESHYAALVGIRTAIGMYDLGAAHRIVLAELGV